MSKGPYRADLIGVGDGDGFRAKLVTRYSLKPLSPTVVDKYKLYIKSAHWTARKEFYYEKYKRECAICYSTASTVDLNHTYYGDLGQERDEDLIPLCRYHHELFHQKYGVKYDMRKECSIYIYEERQRLLEKPMTVQEVEQIPEKHSFADLLETLASPIWRILSWIGIRKPN